MNAGSTEENGNWHGQIPSDWRVQKLKRVFSGIDYGISESTSDEGSFQVLKMGNIVAGEIAFTNIEFVQDVDANLLLRPQDLLFNRTNSLDQVAKVGIFRGHAEGNVTFASYLVRLRTSPRNHPNYINYVLNDDGFIGLARKLAIPSVQQANLNPTRYGRMEVPLPPLPEQKRIAAYLDMSCVAIDQAVETKQKQLETLDALRKSIIQRAVTQGLNPKVKMKESGVDWLGQVPEHWLCESLKRATSRIQTGSTPPTSQPEYYEEGTIEWFAPECFGQTINLRAPKKLINQQAFEDNKVRIFAPETVLFVGIGATIGKVAVLEKEGSANQQIVGISCDHRMISRFLAYQLKNYEKIIPKLAQYTTLPILNQTKVGYLPVLRPPINEQQEICELLDGKELELAKVEKIINEQMATLTAYRKALIHEFVTGKRRISDADVAKVVAHV